MSHTNAHAQFPASSPYVLSVGGTMLTLQRPDNPFSVEEVVCNVPPGRRTDQGGGSTGGGVSGLFPRPPGRPSTLLPSTRHQRTIVQGTNRSRRGRAGGPAVVFAGVRRTAQLNGGTSASTPVWASLLARINAALPAAKRRRRT